VKKTQKEVVTFFEKWGKKTSDKVEEAKLDQKMKTGTKYV